jgi:hypothetical protein
MRNFTLTLVALFIATMSFAQNAPIDFESNGYGANWTWTVFENDSNPSVAIVPNPGSAGINTSSTVARFRALQTGNPWAGCESSHGTMDLGSFVLDTTNNLIKIMVYKPVISDVGIKLVSDSSWAMAEIKVANTLINQWEELTFDFSNHTNPPANQGVYDQIVIFPDWPASGPRTQTNVCYFDNITFNPQVQTISGPTTPAPTPPALSPANVISIYSGAYSDVPGTNFNPGWGQSTLVTNHMVQNDSVMKYALFNYQGIAFADTVDASGMDFLHVDVWSADTINPNIFCISPGPQEKSYNLALTPNQWNSFDIPIAAFTTSSSVDIAKLIQMKFDGGSSTQTIYIDNIYFYIAPPSGPTTAAPVPPTRNAGEFKSIYSDAYPNEPGTDFNPSWGQSTIVTTPHIQNDSMLKYQNFNFQGITLGAALDVNNMDYLHIDMWTADASAVNAFCISTGPVEKSHALAITPNQWVSYDIPMTNFSTVDLTDLIQMKFDGGNSNVTIFLDNIYFYMDNTSIGNNPQAGNSMSLFPNPVNVGELVRLSPNVSEYRVFDLSGQIVRSGNINEISTQGLSKGLYIVELANREGQISTSKLIIN